MKKTLRFLLIPLLLFTVSAGAQITVEILSPTPQSGPHNYFGIRLTLSQTLSQYLTINGYIYDEGNGLNTDHPFSLTIPPNETYVETSIFFYETDPTASATVDITDANIVASYAGVNITYDLYNNILKFASVANVNTVLNQLQADYDYHNDTYDALQDTTLTGDQQDSVDALNGFNDVQPYVNFENLFPGFSSIRAALEYTENEWLNSDFESTDPDNIDLTFDDEENTIFNNSYSFKVGNTLYQLTSSGMYVGGTLLTQSPIKREGPVYANGILSNSNQPFRNAVFMEEDPQGQLVMTDCKSNKKDDEPAVFGNDKYKVKVAIHAIGIRTSAKGKVVHFKPKSGGGWKRSRTKMAVFVGGTIYNGDCSSSFAFSKRNPSSGWKKRKQLKTAYREWFPTTYKTYTNMIGASFDTKAGHNGTLMLTF